MRKIGLAGLCCVLARRLRRSARPPRTVDQSVSSTPARAWDPPADAKLPPTDLLPRRPSPRSTWKPGTAHCRCPRSSTSASATTRSRSTAWFRAAGGRRRSWDPSTPSTTRRSSSTEASFARKLPLTGGTHGPATTYGPSASPDRGCCWTSGGARPTSKRPGAPSAPPTTSTTPRSRTSPWRSRSPNHQYLNRQGLKSAAQASLQGGAREPAPAAQERHRAGVATIADEAAGQNRVLADGASSPVGGRPDPDRSAAPSRRRQRSGQHPGRGGDLPTNVDVDVVSETVDQLIASGPRRSARTSPQPA